MDVENPCWLLYTQKNQSSAMMMIHKRSAQMQFVCSFSLYPTATAAARKVLQPFRSSHLIGPTCSNLSPITQEAEPEIPTADGTELRAGMAPKLVCSNINT